MNISQSVYRQTGLHIKDVPLGLPLKTEIQDASLQCTEPLLVFELVTGLGKSRMALLHGKGLKVLILCKQHEHFKTWEDEIERWDLRPSNLTIMCYSSLHKIAGEHYDVVVLDEVQSLSQARLNGLKQLTWNKLIAVSATIPDEVYQRLFQLGKPRIIKIPMAKAIEWKLVPSPKINVVRLPLDNTVKKFKYQRYLKGAKESLTVDYKDFHKHVLNYVNLDVICTEREYYAILDNNFAESKKSYMKNNYELANEIGQYKQVHSGLSPDQVKQMVDLEFRKQREAVKAMEFRYYNAGGLRKKYLASIRTGIVEKMIEKYNDKRLVVFCNSIEQCNYLAKGRAVLHSESSDTDVVKRFNNGELNHLYAVRQVDESMNLSGEFTAIVISLGGSLIQAIQRLGRSLRKEGSEVFFFYTPNTVDDGYFRKFKKGLSEDFFTYINLDQV